MRLVVAVEAPDATQNGGARRGPRLEEPAHYRAMNGDPRRAGWLRRMNHDFATAACPRHPPWGARGRAIRCPSRMQIWTRSTVIMRL